MWLYLQVRWRYFLQERINRKRYYKNAPFRRVDRALKKAYRFKNPYTISRKFLQKKGESDVHLYGETYLSTYEKIARHTDLKSGDRILELGSGRGRGAFFLHALYQATVHGIEWILTFVGIAQTIADKQGIKDVTFSCEDFLHADFTGFTHIYLYGTCLQEGDIKKLIARFQALPPSVTLITVSYPLTDYSPHFQVQGQFTASFPWGTATLYIQKKV